MVANIGACRMLLDAVHHTNSIYLPGQAVRVVAAVHLTASGASQAGRAAGGMNGANIPHQSAVVKLTIVC